MCGGGGGYQHRLWQYASLGIVIHRLGWGSVADKLRKSQIPTMSVPNITDCNISPSRCRHQSGKNLIVLNFK